MPIIIAPNVRHMILCNEALPDPQWPGRVKVNGLILQLRWPEATTAPLRLDKLVVLLVLAGGRGEGQGWVECIDEETGKQISRSAELPIRFVGKDPVAPFPGRFTLRDCYFTRPGAYLVRFFLDGNVVAQQGLVLR